MGKKRALVPGTAAWVVLAILKAAGGESVSMADVVAQATAQGAGGAAARKAMSNLLKWGDAIQPRRGHYAIRVVDTEAAAPAVPPVKIADGFAPSLGLVCSAPILSREATTTIDSDLRDEILTALDDDVAYNLHDLGALLVGSIPGRRWGKAELRRVVDEMVAAKELATRFDREGSEDVYWLPDADRDEAAPIVAKVEPLAAPAPAAQTLTAPQLTSAVLRDLGLRDRLEAICSDLDDACDDACDAQVPHPLLKDLLAAQRGAQRALRQLER